jgi:predicted PurR-regulated permease PerM
MSHPVLVASRPSRGPSIEESILTAPAQPRRPLVPDWLVQATSLGWRLLVIVALGVVVLGTAAVLSVVVASVVLAAVVTAAFDPLADRFRAEGRSPNATAGLVTLAASGLAVAAIAVIAIAFVPATAELLGAIQAGLQQLDQMVADGSIPPPGSTFVTEFVSATTTWVSSTIGGVVSSLASGFTIILLSIFLLFFFVTDADRAIAWTLQGAAPWQRSTIDDGVGRARRRLGGLLRETAVRAGVLGIVAFVVALILGLPAPLALAVVVTAGTFVPLLGPVATTALFGLVALGAAGGVACLVAVGALVATTILLPRLVGPGRLQGHGIHPAIVLVALTIGGLVAGTLGLILAVPVVVALREVGPTVIAALNGRPDDTERSGLVPRWFDRIAQWSWRLLVLAAVVGLALAALGQIPLIVIPIVLAAVAAATLASGVSALERRGLTPTTAALAMTVGGFGLILVILVLTLAALADPISEMVQGALTGAGKIDDALASGQSVASIVAAFAQPILEAVAVIVRGLAGLGISIALGAILTFFLLRDGATGFEAATRPLTRWRHDELAAAAGRATRVRGHNKIGTRALSVVGAGRHVAIMALLGLPLAWPLAVLSFFGGFIPYIGSFLTTGLAFLVTVAVGDTQDIVIMAIFTLVFNIVTGNIVAPLVYGRAVSIHPAVVLLAIPAGGAVAGVAGMFLAVPLIGVVATTWRTILRVFGSAPPELGDAAPDAAASDPPSEPTVAPAPAG